MNRRSCYETLRSVLRTHMKPTAATTRSAPKMSAADFADLIALLKYTYTSPDSKRYLLPKPSENGVAPYFKSPQMKALLERKKEEFPLSLKFCIEKASRTDDEAVALNHVSEAFRILMEMKACGFPVREESYGQILSYLIDRGMVEQFHLFSRAIKDGTLARLGSHETVLYESIYDEGRKTLNDVVSRVALY